MITVFFFSSLGGLGILTAEVGKSGELTAALHYSLIVAVMSFISLDITGAQFNPAISVALFIVGHQDIFTTIAYMSSHFIGSVFGAILLFLTRPGQLEGLDPNLGSHVISDKIELQIICFLQAFSTMVYFYIYYDIVIFKNPTLNHKVCFLALTNAFMILCVGDTTGGTVNPAKNFGPMLIEGDFFQRGWWTFLTAPFVGAIISAPLCKYVICRNTVIWEDWIEKEEKNDGNANSGGKVELVK